MARPRRRNADQAFAMALACGATVEAAAQNAGISEATAYRRRADPEFCKLLAKTESDLVERTMRMLTGAAGEAVKALLRLTRENAPPTVQLGAARATLEIGMRLREVHDLQQRMAALEAQLQPGPRLANGTGS